VLGVVKSRNIRTAAFVVLKCRSLAEHGVFLAVRFGEDCFWQSLFVIKPYCASRVERKAINS
jgi:hypothetical protein